MTVVLFDIDGTILRTGGAGMRAINQVFREMFGFENKVKVPVRGRTDYGIFTDLFRENGIDFDTHYQSFAAQYHPLLREYMKTSDVTVLPGVMETLDYLKRQNVELGVLTGNSEAAARIKLEHIGVDPYFLFGGYGDHSPNRDDVAAAAIASAEANLGQVVDLENCWVFGDTPADVQCAKSVKAKSVAVLTGGFTAVDFDDSRPDLLVDSLAVLLNQGITKIVK